MTVLELFEVFFDTYPMDLHNDAVAVAAAHAIVLSRLFSVLLNKKKIREYNRYLVIECKGFEDEKVMENQYKKIRNSLSIQAVVMFFVSFMYLVEGLKRRLRDSKLF